MTELRPMTSLEVMSQADAVLTVAGYQPVIHHRWDSLSGSARAFEDRFGVVGVFVFDTVTDLVREWPDAQADLISLLTEFVSRDDDKAWEGYLVLLSPGQADNDQDQLIDAIRRDTSRVRKLVATGADLTVLSDVDQALLCLLPFDVAPPALIPDTALEALPDLLATQGIPRDQSRELVRAFNQQTSLMRSLHDQESAQ